MGRLRVSILGLIAIVVASALAFAALRTASNLWFSALYTFTTVVLLWAVIAARFGQRSTRAFWFGFAVFGWGFLILGSGGWLTPFNYDPDDGIGRNINRELLTSHLVFFLLPHLRKDTVDLEAVNRITANTIGIAHLLITLTLAVVGGTVAALMRRRRGMAKPGRTRGVVASVILLTGLTLGIVASPSDPLPSSAPFFPAEAVEERRGISRFRVEWYSRFLAAMEESPLRPDGEANTYRLLWLPSFNHPVCVRVDRTRDGAWLRARVLDGKGGYEPGKVAIDRKIKLSNDRWNDLERLLEEARFWNMPTRFAGDGGNDGDQLILEGIEGGTYHVVDRWGADAGYTKLCRALLDLSGLEVQKTWEGYHENESVADPEPRGS